MKEEISYNFSTLQSRIEIYIEEFILLHNKASNFAPSPTPIVTKGSLNVFLRMEFHAVFQPNSAGHFHKPLTYIYVHSISTTSPTLFLDDWAWLLKLRAQEEVHCVHIS